MAAVPTLSRDRPGNSSGASFGRRGRNYSSSSASSMDRVRNSVESLLSRASRDNLLSGGRSRNAPGANATFDIVDVPTGGGNSALFLRSGGPPVGGTGGMLASTSQSLQQQSTDGTASNTHTATAATSATAALPGIKSADAASSSASTTTQSADPTAPTAPTAVTANVRYRNEDGRAAVLNLARSINHDFGALTSIVNVTLGGIADLDALSANPDIEWVDRNGAVFFVQPFGKS